VTRAFVYGGEAQAELLDIVRYTARQWGADQARAYVRQIDKAAAELAAGQGIYKDWGAVLTGLRVKAVGSHFVFCVVRPGEPAVVLAILHQRMDLMTRLKERLA
jgi:toxin ParE1/3/4